MVKFSVVFTLCLILFVVLPGKIFARTTLETFKQDAFEWINANRKTYEDAAKAIYGFAETKLREHRSAEYLASLLERNGFAVERGVADMSTAFVATYGSGRPVIGILAEYDALPGLSEKPGFTHKEPIIEGAPGHGCGHNLLGSGSTAAAISVKTVMEKHNLKGKVKLFGCPAEEGTIGKVYMARSGVFDGLDACFTWHPGTKNQVILISSLAKNEFEVIFRGKNAHAASKPWSGRSALDAVELMNIGVNFLREHLKDQVRIHYVITNGGRVPNVVPDYASVWYYVRDVNRMGVEKIYRRVLQCAEGAALMTETTMEVNFVTGVYEYLPNLVLSEVLDRNFRLVGPPKFSEADQKFAKEIQKNLKIPYNGMSKIIEKLEKPSRSSSCSTDAADVSWIVPTAGILTVATAPLGIPGHSWAMTSAAGSPIGFKGMIIAAKVLAAVSIDVLLDQAVLEKAHKEFREKTKGFTYKSAIPLKLKPPVPENK